MEEIISDLQDDILQFQIPYPFIGNPFQSKISPYDISCYGSCRIAVTIVIHCRYYRLIEIIAMPQGAENCYRQCLFSNPASADHAYGIPVIYLPVICKIDSLPNHFKKEMDRFPVISLIPD